MSEKTGASEMIGQWVKLRSDWRVESGGYAAVGFDHHFLTKDGEAQAAKDAQTEADAINAIVEWMVQCANFQYDGNADNDTRRARALLAPLGITAETMAPKLARAERIEKAARRLSQFLPPLITQDRYGDAMKELLAELDSKE